MGKRARKVQRVIGSICFLILLAGLMKGTADLLQRKESDLKYKPFFEQEKDFDVLFMGTSHVFSAVFPMELWKDYGIVSYNFGGNGNILPMVHWTMMLSLDYTTPQIVVIDVFNLEQSEKVSYAEHLHTSTDSFSLSRTKLNMIADLCNDENAQEPIERAEFIWDMFLYHNRWSELTRMDVYADDYVTKEKGAEYIINVAIPQESEVLPVEDIRTERTVGMKYLCQMIEECQSRGIEVVLTNMSFGAYEDCQRVYNAVYGIAEEYGIPYIDFVHMDDFINMQTDLYDSGHSTHLNPSGARKMTEFLGRYLTENYELEDRRQDADFAAWFDDYQAYEEMKVNALRNQRALDNYLMLCSDKNVNCLVYMREDSEIGTDQRMQSLLKNIPYMQIIEKWEEMSEYFSDEADILIIVRHQGDNGILDTGAFMIDDVQADYISASRLDN